MRRVVALCLPTWATDRLRRSPDAPPPQARRFAEGLLNHCVGVRGTFLAQAAFKRDLHGRARVHQFLQPPFEVRPEQRVRPRLARRHHLHRAQTQSVPALDHFAARVGDFHVIDKIIPVA